MTQTAHPACFQIIQAIVQIVAVFRRIILSDFLCVPLIDERNTLSDLFPAFTVRILHSFENPDGTLILLFIHQLQRMIIGIDPFHPAQGTFAVFPRMAFDSDCAAAFAGTSIPVVFFVSLPAADLADTSVPLVLFIAPFFAAPAGASIPVMAFISCLPADHAFAALPIMRSISLLLAAAADAAVPVMLRRSGFPADLTDAFAEIPVMVFVSCLPALCAFAAVPLMSK